MEALSRLAGDTPGTVVRRRLRLARAWRRVRPAAGRAAVGLALFWAGWMSAVELRAPAQIVMVTQGEGSLGASGPATPPGVVLAAGPDAPAAAAELPRETAQPAAAATEPAAQPGGDPGGLEAAHGAAEGAAPCHEDGAVGSGPPPIVGAPVPQAPPGRAVDINRASAGELEALPGIGPALAARIVEFRATYGPFSTVDDLVEVPGIGPKTLERLRGLVTVSGGR